MLVFVDINSNVIKMANNMLRSARHAVGYIIVTDKNGNMYLTKEIHHK